MAYCTTVAVFIGVGVVFGVVHAFIPGGLKQHLLNLVHKADKWFLVVQLADELVVFIFVLLVLILILVRWLFEAGLLVYDFTKWY